MQGSSKVVKDVIEAISIKYNNMVYEMKDKGEDVIVLSLGEAFFDLPLYPFDDLPYPNIYHYSHSRGIYDLRNNISKYFEQEYNFIFNPETEIIVTAGSKVGIHMALMSILDPGDEVIIFEPYWVSYTEQVKLCYAVPVTVPKDVNIFDMSRYVTKKTKCIILNNPNNPIGRIYAKKELDYLLNIAVANGLYILSDEAYSDFVPEGSFISMGLLDDKLQNTIICNSISKNFGISGWRLGYVIANSNLIDEILKVNQHLITCPATILEYYIAKHFHKLLEVTKPQIQKLIKYRQRVADYMKSINLEFMHGTATWYFFVSIEPSKLTSEEFCTKLLIEKKTSTVPGIGYGASCDKNIRVCVGTESWERTVKGLNVIKKLIEETSYC